MNKIFTTEDGSHSVISDRFGVSYHSRYGAIQESLHVFVEAALRYKILRCSNKNIHVLEIGLGTGLNALLSCMVASAQNRNLKYTAYEKFPLTVATAKALNYPQLIDLKDATRIFLRLHTCGWETFEAITPDFQIKKVQADCREIRIREVFDIIYYDAFAPAAQAELWSEAQFQIMYNALKPSGVLSTYCAKGSVKRALRSVGFEVESIPGPPGKREITRAIKN